MPNLVEKQQQRRLRVGPAAKYVGLSAATMRKMRSKGNGPAYIKIGAGIILYDVADLDDWLESHKRRSGSTEKSG